MKVTRPRNIRPIESLEARLFLSATSSNGLTSAQLSHLHNAAAIQVHLAHSPTRNPLSIVSSDLAQLYTSQSSGETLTADSFGAIETQNNDPAIAVHARGNLKTLLKRLEKLGLDVINVVSSSHVINGYLPVASLVPAAKLAGVQSINAIYKATVHSVGSAVNQADQAMNAELARSLYGLTGAGVKIGVISDSVSQTYGGLSDSISSGDLPKVVTVLQDGSYGDTDEGRAILEEIHDLAPGASLYFYSGDGDQTSMVTAVNSLKNAGCKIIVDDLGYGGEPFFQDGVISQAINSFVASGGSYFSAIGNDGNSGYLRTNVNYTTDASNKTWVNFATTGLAADNSLRFTLNGSATIDLQWDNPYNGVTGSATSDLNLYVYNFNGSQLIASSTNSNIASGIPEETLHLKPGTYEMRVQVAALSSGAVAPDMIKFVASADASGGLAYVNYAGTMSSAMGHGAGQNTISVGAVPFSSAPPFSSATPIHSENYSSTGPVVYAFDASGKKLAAPLTMDKPDVSGVDGINTSFFGEQTATDPTYLPQFFGTSAAAPNVAAIAALIDQFKPGTTQASILAALKASATPLNGAAAGTWNPQGGYGLVDAVKALKYFGNAAGTVPSAQFAAISTPRQIGVSSEAITFNEAVSGFDLSDLTLTRNGGANLLTASQTLSSSDQTTFTLGNLTSLTATPGSYVLTLKSSGTGITGGGLALTTGASVSWTVTPPPPTVKFGSIVTPRLTSISSETFTFSQAVTGFTLSSLSLTRGGANLLTAAQTLTTTDHITYTLNNLTNITRLAGNYTLTLTAAGIENGTGQTLFAGGKVTWRTNAIVSAERLVYNDSAFDKYTAAAGSSDDAAIAIDKTALLPGHKATFSNYSSFYKGINGVDIDITGLPATTLTAADFIFKTGNSNTTSTWATAPSPSSILVRPGAGIGGSTRVELIWPDHSAANSHSAIAKKWLQVTVKADSNTGLGSNFVFYFGNAIGETGNSKTDAAVTSADVAAINSHLSSAAVPITSNWDITRDGKITSADAAQASGNQTSGATALQLITPV